MKAGNEYDRIRMKTLSGRDIEAAVLEKAAVNLRKAQNEMEPGRINDTVEDALNFNKRIWDVFRADWQNPDSHLPREVRQNLLSLCVFLTKQMLDFRADPVPEKLESMARINETLIDGLRGNVSRKTQAQSVT